jgi:hypothetical protein
MWAKVAIPKFLRTSYLMISSPGLFFHTRAILQRRLLLTGNRRTSPFALSRGKIVQWPSCWNLVVGFSPWLNANSEILLAHSCLAGDSTKVRGLRNYASVPSLLIFLLFGKITVRVISLSAVSGFSGSWAITNSDVGCAPRLTRPALYKQA